MADNFFVSSLRFSLDDDTSLSLGKISNNFQNAFKGMGDSLLSFNKLAGIAALYGAKKAYDFTKSAILDYSDLEQHIVSLGLALDTSNENAEHLISSFSLLKNAIPLEEVRKFVISLASASEKGKELSKNKEFVETALKLSQAKGLGLDKILDFSTAIAKAYRELSPEKITALIADLSTLSVKAVEGISSVTTQSLQELRHYGVDIQKLIPLLGTLQEFTGSSSEGLGKILSIFGDLQGEKGALAFASLGIVGDRNFTEEYFEAMSKFPQGVNPEEIANVLSDNWKKGMNKLIKEQGGDVFKSIGILFENLKKLGKEQSSTYLIDLLGQPNIALLNVLTSKEAKGYYKQSIEKTKESEKTLEEQYNRRQETLSATFEDTSKLLSQVSEEMGKFAANLLNIKEIFQGFNEFLRTVLTKDETEWLPTIAGTFTPMGLAVALSETIKPYVGGYIEEFDEAAKNLFGINKNGIFNNDTGNNTSTNIMPVMNNSTSTNSKIPSSTFNYSPVFNIQGSSKEELTDIMFKDKIDFFIQSNRLNMLSGK